MNETDQEITFDLVGCARCDGDGHPGLTFTKLTHPCLDFTHWAPCPTNGEPIMLAFADKD